jgi:hypothetical protein
VGGAGQMFGRLNKNPLIKEVGMRNLNDDTREKFRNLYVIRRTGDDRIPSATPEELKELFTLWKTNRPQIVTNGHYMRNRKTAAAIGEAIWGYEAVWGDGEDESVEETAIQPDPRAKTPEEKAEASINAENFWGKHTDKLGEAGGIRSAANLQKQIDDHNDMADELPDGGIVVGNSFIVCVWLNILLLNQLQHPKYVEMNINDICDREMRLYNCELMELSRVRADWSEGKGYVTPPSLESGKTTGQEAQRQWVITKKIYRPPYCVNLATK